MVPAMEEKKRAAKSLKKAVKYVAKDIARNFAAVKVQKKQKLESLDAPQEESAESPVKKPDVTISDPEKKKWTYRVGDPEIDCKLTLGSVDNIVAHATVIEMGDDNEVVIHEKPLGADNRRVSIYFAVDEKTKLPFPVEGEFETVKQAMGSWVACPKDWIILSNEVKVTGNIMASYQRYLYNKLEAYGMVDMIAFVHPSQIGAVGCGDETKRTENIARRLTTAKPGQVFMLPYNSGAMVMANADRKKGRNSVIPKNMAGMPFQLGNTECRFYVMQYMREIIEDKDTSQFVTKWKKRDNCKYNQDDFDDVRDEWADFVVKNYVKKP